MNSLRKLNKIKPIAEWNYRSNSFSKSLIPVSFNFLTFHKIQKLPDVISIEKNTIEKNNFLNVFSRKLNSKENKESFETSKIRTQTKILLNIKEDKQENVDDCDDSFLEFQVDESDKNLNSPSIIKEKKLNEKFVMENSQKNKINFNFHSKELGYLANFNEDYFGSEKEIKEIISQNSFNLFLGNFNKSVFLQFCFKFPLFAFLILESNIKKMKEINFAFDNSKYGLLANYLDYFKIILIGSKFLKNQEFFRTKASIVFQEFFDLIKLDENINEKSDIIDNKKNTLNNDLKAVITTQTVLIDFVKNLKSIEKMENISTFYFLYNLICTVSKLKDILINDDKLDFIFNLNDPEMGFQTSHSKAYSEIFSTNKRDKKYNNNNNSKNFIDEINKNTNNDLKCSNNLKDYIINMFPKLFMKIYKKEYFYSNQKLTKYLINLLLMYEIEFVEDKTYIDINFSLFLNVLDEILEIHILQMKNNFLIMNLLNVICSYKIIVKKEIRGFQNIYSSIAKKFMKNEDIFEEKNSQYLFMYFLYVKFIYKSIHSLKDVAYLINANFYFIDYLIKTHPQKLEKVSDWLLCHLFMSLGYSNFYVHENLYLEIKKRIPKLLEDFNINIITYLITGMVLNKKKDNELFKKILTHSKLQIYQKKNILNIGFYISLSLYDDVEAWKSYFKKFEIMINELNSFDKRQVLEMIMSLLTTKNIKENKQMSDYLNRILKRINFKASIADNSFSHKWFINISTSNGFAEHTFKNYLEKNNIKFVFQKNLFDIFDVDFLIGDKVIIYLNGPIHYYTNGKEELNFKSLSKTRILEDKGYYVVNVSLEDCSLISHKINASDIILDYIKGKLPSEIFEQYFIQSRQNVNVRNFHKNMNKENFDL